MVCSAVTDRISPTGPSQGRARRADETKVFIVEDEELVAFDIKRILEGMGLTVTGMAGTTPEALKQIEASRPDLVLVDLSLGGRFDGMELARVIQDRWNTPVLFISGHFGDTAVTGLDQIKTAGYLAKPFYPVNLREAVESVLRTFAG